MRGRARGTEALIARFEKQFERSEGVHLRRLRHSSQGTSGVRLLCGLAQHTRILGTSPKKSEGSSSANGARAARPDAVNAELAIKTWETESVGQRSLHDDALPNIYLGIARST